MMNQIVAQMLKGTLKNNPMFSQISQMANSLKGKSESEQLEELKKIMTQHDMKTDGLADIINQAKNTAGKYGI